MDKVAQLVGLYIFIFHKMYIYIVSFTLFTYPAFQLKLNSTDYLREARNELLDTTEYNEEMFDW